MFCGNCGKKIPDNVKFCPFCGNKNERETEIGQLVLDAAAGKTEAIEKIYHMTYAQGFAVAMQMVKNEQDAMDLLQDAYISAFQNLNKLNRPEAFRSWFNCIVANNCRDWIRKKKPDLVTFRKVPM